jgi:hypothetical protein
MLSMYICTHNLGILTRRVRNCGLGYISRRFLASAKCFFVIPIAEEQKYVTNTAFTRVRTSPLTGMHGGMPQRHLSRTHTQLMHGVDRSDLMFFFGHNSIRELPAELFELSRLTALSLRAFYFDAIY